MKQEKNHRNKKQISLCACMKKNGSIETFCALNNFEFFFLLCPMC
jgi:hypothetical protein